MPNKIKEQQTKTNKSKSNKTVEKEKSNSKFDFSSEIVIGLKNAPKKRR